MGVDYNMSVKALNERWAKQINTDSWSQMVIKHTKDTLEHVTEAPQSGIWKIFDTGHIKFDRMDSHRRAVESEDEAFFLRISNKGDYLYEGADMGILVGRGRLMTDKFNLTERAKTWMKAIRSQYSSHEVKKENFEPEIIGSLMK
jgi:hypothetical protein